MIESPLFQNKGFSRTDLCVISLSEWLPGYNALTNVTEPEGDMSTRVLYIVMFIKGI